MNQESWGAAGWIAVGLMAAGLPATAAELSPKDADPLLIELHRQVSVAGGGTYLDYNEKADGLRESDSGWLPNIQVSGSWLFDSGLFLEAGADTSFGDTDYGLSGAGTPANERQTHNDLVATYGKFGFSAAANDRVLFTPYLTYGFQYWKREITFGADYDRSYTTHYLGGGLMTDIGVAHNLVATIDLMGASTIASEQEIDIHAPGFDAFEFDTKNAPLARAALSLDYKLAPHFHVFTAARYTYIVRDEPSSPDIALSADNGFSGYDSDSHELNLSAGARLTF